ncbi:MAG: maleylpyruvate isomerase family mycothiol-dependent enzyme [Actinomycetota bacterium]
MTAQIPRDRTVAALDEEWASIEALLSELRDDEWSIATVLPGWDVKDNVAHIIGTEQMLLGHPVPGIEIDRDAHAHVHNDIGAFNEVWVESLRAESPASVRSLFADVTTRRRAALAAMTQEEWDAESFTPAGPATYGRFMQIRVYDCWYHEQDIRDAVGRPGNESGLVVEVTLDELTTAMGFVVGKKAGATDGQSVTFALTDDDVVVREIHVLVDGRAGVVSSLPGPATATLTMPVGVMTRRSAGRVPLDVDDPRIAIDGDVDLAANVLRHQTYTL